MALLKTILFALVMGMTTYPCVFAENQALYRPSEIIVRFADDASAEARSAVLRRNDCQVTGYCRRSLMHRVDISPQQEAMDVLTRLNETPAVDYAELNYLTWAFFVPNDVLYPIQWNLHASDRGGINAEPGWDIHTGDPKVRVAVLDTGVAYEDFDGFFLAPDLSGTRFVPGYDYINNDAHPNDDHGHGTHVAGTIAQSTNNGLGVAGIAFGCSIMPVKILDHKGIGDQFTLARGIHFAVDNGAQVINLSLGSEGGSQTLLNALVRAKRAGTMVVCAAGNEFLDGNPVTYPAAYDDYCLSVGATAYDLERARYSSTGTYVDVVAPGGEVSTDLNHDGFVDGILQQTFRKEVDDFSYWFFQGTSMAAPHVSGAVALVMSSGITDLDRVREAIEQTAVDLGPVGWDVEFGWGLLDLGAAMTYWPSSLQGRNSGDIVLSSNG
ncbi:S8 family peptidase [Planctomycetota bacterium]